jgi:adenine-specific DNA-methyltransferase
MPKTKRTPIESIRHDERRANIPTEELRDFVAHDEAAPPAMLYPRDPSLDPQLVWKGKDEQDRADLSVPVVPIYIQEKIHPQAIIQDFVAQARKAQSGGIAEEPAAYQLNLFADFNGLEDDFSRKVDFYSHADGNRPHWSNRMILGDSLLVMTSLAEKEGLKGQVQMIYIDPPYGIKFGSNWQVSTRKRDVKDGSAADATRQPEQVKAFRDTWQLGIHSYLSYLRDRLVAARELLTETGSVFVQIGDENVHLVRALMDEVFGSENFGALITFAKTSGQTPLLLPEVMDYLLWYAKNKEVVKFRKLFIEKREIPNPTERYVCVETTNNLVIDLSVKQKMGEEPMPEGKVLRLRDTTSQSGTEVSQYDFMFERKVFRPAKNRHWSTSRESMARVALAGRLYPVGASMRWKNYFDDFSVQNITNIWTDLTTSGFGEQRVYVVQTNTSVIQRCLLMTTDPGDLVLDPTCGSGTTAAVAEQWGRRWITIDTSRVALALARTRLMSARYPYYHLAADHPDLHLSATDEEIKAYFKNPQMNADAHRYKDENLHLRLSSSSSADVKKGFVYRRVPHITLKSIANNHDIDAIHDKWQPELDALRAEINRATGERWEEWEVPRPQTNDGGRPPAVAPLLARWWELRRERQAEIDAAISRHADTELLYDQPYEDNKRLRVAGPFTVESLSPHRTIDPQMGADGRRYGEKEKNLHLRKSASSADSISSSSDFTAMILDNLRKAGVQNTKKGERLKFDRLDAYPGRWLHAAGEYTDSDGRARRVAVSIGPEHNTVGPQQIKDAAKEAVQGVGFDLLLVCGFAFDPHVNEEATRYGVLTVQPVRMNPDLAMGDELLKKTGAGNLFMIFGEPDLKQEIDADGRLTVELLGLDIYDPTTGEIRSSSTDDIACWFIDTDYDGESFFVRHAYFTGADEPYDKLKRALRAEVDEAAWSELYSTRSRPFDRPESGRIAVKVINHYGDEVLKVYEV